MDRLIPTENQKPGLGNPQDVQVLMYRNIVRYKDDADKDTWSVHVGKFRRQMELLDRRGFTTITFEDYSLFLEGALNLPHKPVIIVFEEAYLELYELAFPILQELGMKAVVFVVADQGIRRSIWDRLEGRHVLPLMTERQVIEMHSAGFEIGSHSLTHANLTTLPRETAWEEISRSRMLLEIMLNAPVRSFAYPYGAFGAETKTMVADAGYTIACGLGTGLSRLDMDPLGIRPLMIHNRITRLGFALRLLPGYRKYQWGSWQLRQLFTSTDGD
jgi:peptidoglycan/xylan/chitin deacetylase (PgdA/CDA1 family)